MLNTGTPNTSGNSIVWPKKSSFLNFMNEFLFEITFEQAAFQFRVKVLFKSFSPPIYLFCEFLCNIKWLCLSGTTKVEKNMQKHQLNVDLLAWWEARKRNKNASCVAGVWYTANTQIHVHRYFTAVTEHYSPNCKLQSVWTRSSAH